MEIKAQEFFGDYSVDKNGKAIAVIGVSFDVEMLAKLSNPSNFTNEDIVKFFATMMDNTLRKVAENVILDAITGTLNNAASAKAPTESDVMNSYNDIMSKYKKH